MKFNNRIIFMMDFFWVHTFGLLILGYKSGLYFVIDLLISNSLSGFFVSFVCL